MSYNNFNENIYKIEENELKPTPTLGIYLKNNTNDEFNFNNQFDNITDIENLIEHNDYISDPIYTENLNKDEPHKNSYKPNEPFIDNFENNDLIEFSGDNKEKSKKNNTKNENEEINNNIDNLGIKLDLENYQTSSTFDTRQILENKDSNNNNILKDKDNNSNNNEDIDSILKYIDDNILKEDYGSNEYQIDNYLNIEEFPFSSEFKKDKNQNKNMDLYTPNETTNNNNFLLSNQNEQNIDLYTTNEAFNDNYLALTDNKNNGSNFPNETFKENDLLLENSQNTDIYNQIETNKYEDNHLTSINNKNIDSIITHDKIDDNYLVSKDNKNIDSDIILKDIINDNFLPINDNQTNLIIDSYITNDIINNNNSDYNENIDLKNQIKTINDNNLTSTNNIKETKSEYISYPPIKEGRKYIGSKITNIKLPPIHLEDEIEHNKIKNIIIPYKNEIIIPVKKKIEVPIPKKIQVPIPKKIQIPIPKTSSISPPKAEEIITIKSSYDEPSPSLIRYDSHLSNNEFTNQIVFPENNLTSIEMEAPIQNNISPVQVSSTINYSPDNIKISSKEIYENYSIPFNYKNNSIPRKSIVKHNVGSPIIDHEIKYNASTNKPVKYNISTYPLQSSIIYSQKTSPIKYKFYTTKLKTLPIKHSIVSQSKKPKLKYSISSGLMKIPRTINLIEVPSLSSNSSSPNKYNFSSFKLKESHSYNTLSNPHSFPSKLYNVPRQKKSKNNYIIRTNSLNPSNKNDLNSYSKETNNKYNFHSYKSTPQITFNNNSSNTSFIRYNSPVGYNIISNLEYPFQNNYTYNKNYNDFIYKSSNHFDNTLSPGIEINRVYSPLNNDKLLNNIYRPKRFRDKPKRKKKVIYIKKSLLKN